MYMEMERPRFGKIDPIKLHCQSQWEQRTKTSFLWLRVVVSCLVVNYFV